VELMHLISKGLILAVALGVPGSDPGAQTRPTAAASRREASPQISSTAPSEVLRELDQALDDVAERVLPAVVQISVSGFGPSHKQRDGESVIERQRGIGSGVIVDPSGYIVTNAHVVTGAQRIQVIMASVTTELVPFKTSLLRRQHTFEARLIGIHQFTDLALLKIEGTRLPFVPLREEYKARLGQTVLAVGSPEGLDHTVTRGIVSALGRQRELDHPMIYIQTDAPINPGNSGGALVDRNGNLLGINTFIYTQGGGSEGLGFAIPEPTVRFIYEELKQYGHVRQTVIGAKAQTITSTLAAGLKLPQDWGVIISDVVPGGPADKGGLKPKDIVLAVDNRVIDSLPKFAASLFLHRHDEPVQMDVLWGVETLKLYIPAVEARGGVERLSDLIDPQKSLIVPLGIFVLELDKAMADSLSGLRSSTGVIVAGKVDYTPAIDVDLAAGDVVHSINGIQLTNTNHLRSELERFKTGDPVVLEIERQGGVRHDPVSANRSATSSLPVLHMM
jgi:serine protease Do